MLSYHNDPSIKQKFVLRFAAHREMDQVIQGTGFDQESQHGCFAFERELGWPEWLARLADTIFEGLPVAKSAQFGTDLLAAVPVGVDLENVQYAIAIIRHKQQLVMLESNKEPYADECRKAIQGVIDFCQLKINKDESAESAAESAAWSAESAAWSAESAAWSAYYENEAAILISVLKEWS